MLFFNLPYLRALHRCCQWRHVLYWQSALFYYSIDPHQRPALNFTPNIDCTEHWRLDARHAPCWQDNVSSPYLPLLPIHKHVFSHTHTSHIHTHRLQNCPKLNSVLCTLVTRAGVWWIKESTVMDLERVQAGVWQGGENGVLRSWNVLQQLICPTQTTFPLTLERDPP